MDEEWNTQYYYYDDAKYPPPVRFKLPAGQKRNFPPKKAAFDMSRLGSEILNQK